MALKAVTPHPEFLRDRMTHLPSALATGSERGIGAEQWRGLQVEEFVLSVECFGRGLRAVWARGGHGGTKGVPRHLQPSRHCRTRTSTDQGLGLRFGIYREIVNPEGCRARRAARAHCDGVVVMPATTRETVLEFTLWHL